MSKEFGNDFMTIIDDDGNEFNLELLDTIDYNGETFSAFLPADMRTRTATSCLNPSTTKRSSKRYTICL